MDLIAKEWKCDLTRYKKIEGLTEQERRIFIARHAQTHFDEHKGKIAAILGNFDHTGSISSDEENRLQVLSMKMIISALYFANELGIDAEHFFRVAPALVVRVP